MSSLPNLSLNNDWVCNTFELDPDLYEFAHDGQPVADLRAWACDRRYDDGWAAWLQKTFDLPMTDVCINYTLRIARAPKGTVVSINGTRLGEMNNGNLFEMDVTDYVTLEDNVIRFRVICGGEGSFGDIILEGIPCA